jgi:hypothetical protein
MLGISHPLDGKFCESFNQYIGLNPKEWWPGISWLPKWTDSWEPCLALGLCCIGNVVQEYQQHCHKAGPQGWFQWCQPWPGTGRRNSWHFYGGREG